MEVLEFAYKNEVKTTILYLKFSLPDVCNFPFPKVHNIIKMYVISAQFSFPNVHNVIIFLIKCT